MERSRQASCSSVLARPVLALLRAQGHDLGALLEGTDVELSMLESADGRLDHTQMLLLFDAARELSGDPLLGLHAPAYLNTGDFDLVEYVAASCENVREAIEATGRYLHLLAEALSFALDVQPTRAVWTLAPDDPVLLPPIAAEYVAGAVASIARRILGIERGDPDVLAVWLPHAPLGDPEEYQRVMPARVLFEQPSLSLVMRPSLLDRPMPAADPALRALLERHARAAAAERPLAGFADEVRARITAELRAGDPGAEHVARLMGMSSRTLHRRLKEEGTTFKDLLDDTRHRLALAYLADPRLSIGEVAFLLGFSDPSPFHRAFKRWTGKTPREVRSA